MRRGCLASTACSRARSRTRSSASSRGASTSRCTSTTASPASRSSGSSTAPCRRRSTGSGAASRRRSWSFRNRRITVNLAPAQLRKEGSSFDLPIALAILAASRQFPPERLDEHAAVGELGLDGRLRRVGGVLAVAEARDARRDRPADLPGRLALRRRRSPESSRCPRGTSRKPSRICAARRSSSGSARTDTRRRCVCPISPTCAATSARGARSRSPPRAGTTCCSQGRRARARRCSRGGCRESCRRSSRDEALEVTRIHSVAGLVSAERPLITTPPFRAPHHSASTAAIVGGGPGPRPGEATLAHRGVLLLDELPEFHRPALEALRQPLEDGVVAIARAAGAAVFPARFQLVGTMNLCACGARGDPGAECSCSPQRHRGVPRQALARAARPLRPRRHGAAAARGRARRSGRRGVRARARPRRRGARARAPAVANAAPPTSCCPARSTGCRSPRRGRARVARVARTIAALAGADAVEPGARRRSARLPLAAGARPDERRARILDASRFPPLLARDLRPAADGSMSAAAPTTTCSAPAVAIVGARACSSYGAQVARTLGRELAAAGLVVVSGLARGIDGEAHRGALEAGGVTVGVLGCGIDRDYPAAHAELARRIRESGLVVSEYEPGVEPAPWRFPARNRIIAGPLRRDRRRRGARAQRRADHGRPRARGRTRRARGSRRDHVRALRRHERAAQARRGAVHVRRRRARAVRPRRATSRRRRPSRARRRTCSRRCPAPPTTSSARPGSTREPSRSRSRSSSSPASRPRATGSSGRRGEDRDATAARARGTTACAPDRRGLGLVADDLLRACEEARRVRRACRREDARVLEEDLLTARRCDIAAALVELRDSLRARRDGLVDAPLRERDASQQRGAARSGSAANRTDRARSATSSASRSASGVPSASSSSTQYASTSGITPRNPDSFASLRPATSSSRASAGFSHSRYRWPRSAFR